MYVCSGSSSVVAIAKEKCVSTKSSRVNCCWQLIQHGTSIIKLLLLESISRQLLFRSYHLQLGAFNLCTQKSQGASEPVLGYPRAHYFLKSSGIKLLIVKLARFCLIALKKTHTHSWVEHIHVIRTTKYWQHLHAKSRKRQRSCTASAPVNNSRGRLSCLPGPGYIIQHTWAQHRPRTAWAATHVHDQQPHTPLSSAEHSASIVPEVKATIMSRNKHTVCLVCSTHQSQLVLFCFRHSWEARRTSALLASQSGVSASLWRSWERARQPRFTTSVHTDKSESACQAVDDNTPKSFAGTLLQQADNLML